MAGLADATEARTLIRQLNQLYDENRRAFRVEEVAGGFELLTRPQFAPYLRRLGHVPQAMAYVTIRFRCYYDPANRPMAVPNVAFRGCFRVLYWCCVVLIVTGTENSRRPYFA